MIKKAKKPLRQGLNIIIVGCGKVDMTLIEQLSKEGHDITIIDKNTAKVQEMSNLYDIMGLAGNGASYSIQMEASLETARILYLPTALEVNSFAHGQAEIIKFKIPENNILDGMTIATLGQMTAGDIISFVAPRRYIRSFLQKTGFKTKQVKNTLIIGGRKASYYLAKQLLAMGISVKIIEQNKERCEELSVLLPDAIIINGDGTDQELLREEGIEYAESFIPLTGIDEENVISGLDLGSVIYPRYITSEAIIAYVRAKKNSMNSNIETLYHMFDNRAEAIEFRVDEPSKVTGIPLKDLTLKKDLLVSFIYRNGSVRIPSGQDTIEVGDTVMIVTTHTGLDNIQDILK